MHRARAKRRAAPDLPSESIDDVRNGRGAADHQWVGPKVIRRIRAALCTAFSRMVPPTRAAADAGRGDAVARVPGLQNPDPLPI
jgi:hypothetical protein